MSDVNVELIGWLKDFESCVRTLDYEKAQKLVMKIVKAKLNWKIE